MIAGGGIAGLTAGLVSARLGRRTLILTGPMLGGNLLSIESIEAYPGYPSGIAGYELLPSIQEQASEAGAEFAMTEIAGLEPDGDGWRVRAGDGEYGAAAVIVASGTAPRALGVPGEDRLRGKGVSHCASCDAPLLRGKPVAVIGGGDSALQEALTLAGAASRVAILTRGDTLTAQAVFQARAAAHDAIDIRFNVGVEEILGRDTVEALRVRDTLTDAILDLEFAAAFVYIGMRPNTGFLHGLTALDGTGRVVAGGDMGTQAPGLFAAGTVRSGSAGRAVAAAGDGTIAAIAADRYLADGG